MQVLSVEANPVLSPAGFRMGAIPVPLSGDEEYRLAGSERIEISSAELLFARAFANPNEGEVIEAASECPIEFVLSGMSACGVACAGAILHPTDAREIDIAAEQSIGDGRIVENSLSIQ